ncbi:MAG: hydrolase [Paenibacillaceae bacterium]|jgi:tRNA threonylcarbamoyladenosine biosynthesis protein TsaE|nr:hydrolase [Paenibacillaceae bacterium]
MDNKPVSYHFDSEKEEDTYRLARELTRLFVPGTVIGLDGDLGAGKTTFSKAVGQALEVQETVNSPTFTIIKEYEGRTMPFYHMDVYRITQEEAEDMGLDDYFYGDGVTLVEWASIIGGILPEEHLSVYIENTGWTARRFHLAPAGAIYEKWCSVLKEQGTIHDKCIEA